MPIYKRRLELGCIITLVKTRLRIKAIFFCWLGISLAGCSHFYSTLTPTYDSILATREMRMTILKRALSATPALDFITLPAPTFEPTLRTALTGTALAKDNPTPGNTTPGLIPPHPCPYVWLNKTLPEKSLKLQAALSLAGLGNVQGRADGYGEYCQDSLTQRESFGVMQTDFRLLAIVSDSQNFETTGRLLHAILTAILKFPPGTFPGPFPGHVGIVFQSNSPPFELWFSLTRGKQALEKGLDGAELIKAINGSS